MLCLTRQISDGSLSNRVTPLKQMHSNSTDDADVAQDSA